MRRGEKDHARRMRRETFDDGFNGGWRGGPDEKDGSRTLERGVE